jgi:hypothetical protein
MLAMPHWSMFMLQTLQSVKFYVSYASVCQNVILATLQSVKWFMLANIQGVFY